MSREAASLAAEALVSRRNIAERAARKLAEELGAAVLIVAVRNQDPDQVAVER